MAILFDGPVTPDALTTFVREVPAPPGLGLLNAFPTRFEDDNKVDWSEITRTNRTARFRSFDGRIHVSERDTGSDKKVNLLPLSTSLSKGELEALQLEFARTGGTRDQALVTSIYNDATNLTREVQNRLELAWGDVLSDGKLTLLDANGEPDLEADFGVPSTQIVSTLDAWTNTTTADVLTEMIAWFDVWKANSGGVEGVWRTSQRVIRLMQRNKEIIDAVSGAAAQRTMVTLAELNNVLADHGLPSVAPSYDGQVDVDGTATRVIADDKLLLTPADLADLGSTRFGVSATALKLVGSNLSEMDFEEAPGIVGVVEAVGPPYREFVFVDAVAMPVLDDAKRLLVADVA